MLDTSRLGGTRRTPRRRTPLLAGAVVVVVVAAVACKPLAVGGASAQIGNDASGCAQFQPVPGCTPPQPAVWATIAGPYEPFENGDPYATKCARNAPVVSPAACSGGTYAGGATNELYDPTGYEYAIDVKPADVGKRLSLQVYDAPAAARTVAPSGPDCSTDFAPFNAAPYSGSVDPENCQTGDTGSAPLQIQLFDNDGVDNSISYVSPGPNGTSCELYIEPADTVVREATKNHWWPVCTFTATQAGIYPFRVKSSNIRRPDGTVIADHGSGSNNFALRVTGGTQTRLHGLDTIATFANTPGSSRSYLAEIGPEHAGQTLQVDIFDPGDGSGGAGQNSVQILAPPSGVPAIVPNNGTSIPAANIADTCRYNPVASPTRGPEVASPAGSVATNCTVVVRDGTTNRYDNGWLSIEIHIADTYSCTVDCWWSVRTKFGQPALPTDRVVWAPILIPPS